MGRRVRPDDGRQVELTVRSIGDRGDGVAEWDGRPVFLANTVPGDRVRARLTVARGGGSRGEVLELDGRQTPEDLAVLDGLRYL